MTSIEEINQITKNLYDKKNKIKIIINILKNKIQSEDYELYELQKRIKKETTAQ